MALLFEKSIGIFFFCESWMEVKEKLFTLLLSAPQEKYRFFSPLFYECVSSSLSCVAEQQSHIDLSQLF